MQRGRVGLVALGLVPADDDVEEVGERKAGKRQVDGRSPFGGHESEQPVFRLQREECVLDALKRLELVVERLVVRAVDAHELVDAVGRKRLHLGLEPRPADVRHQLGLGVAALEHGLGGMPHRSEDDPAGVDDSAVEVEEHDGKAHPPDRSQRTHTAHPVDKMLQSRKPWSDHGSWLAGTRVTGCASRFSLLTGETGCE